MTADDDAVRSDAPFPSAAPAATPAAFLWFLARRQIGRVLLGALWGILWMISLMAPPYLISRAIDEGMRTGDAAATAAWVCAVLGVSTLIAVFGILRHRTMTMIRMDASFRAIELMVRRTTVLGSTLPRRRTAGEVVTAGINDVWQASQTLTIAGPGVGSVVAVGIVAYLLLSTSPGLGAIVLIGVPMLVGVVRPLIARLQVRQDLYRTQDARLTSLVGDIVEGLPVLAGIGGRDTFRTRYARESRSLRDTGYRVGAVTSWIDALAAGVPAIFLALVVWLAARLALNGEITVGELFAVYGYVAVLVTPISFFIEGANDLGRGMVAARRILDFLELEPDVTDEGTLDPVRALLHDPGTGLTVPPGRLVAVVSVRFSDALGLVDRLARRVESDARLGDTPLAEVRLDPLRRAVLPEDGETHLFGGPLHEVLGGGDSARLTAALHAAAGDDVVRSLSGGLDTQIRPGAVELSGGQRQRLRLARALAAAPATLLLVEPTSAVDAHTEALVVDRVPRLREGLTTVVFTTSPAWLQRADEVVFVVDGRARAAGTHATLLRTVPDYRAFVIPRAGETDEAQPGGTGVPAAAAEVIR